MGCWGSCWGFDGLRDDFGFDLGFWGVFCWMGWILRLFLLV